MNTKNIILLFYIFLIACNSKEVNNPIVSTHDSIVYPNNVPQVWKKEVLSRYDEQFPQIYTYYIKWSKGDSIITYRVSSKYRNTLSPNQLEHLTIQTNKLSIDIDFINAKYIKDLPSFSSDFSDIDKNKAYDISISTDTLRFNRNEEAMDRFHDSMANLLFK